MVASGRKHRHRICRILLLADRLPHFQVCLSGSNSERADGDCRFGLADLCVTSAGKISVSLQFGYSILRGSIGVRVAPGEGGERSTMEGAGQRRGRVTNEVIHMPDDALTGQVPHRTIETARLIRS